MLPVLLAGLLALLPLTALAQSDSASEEVVVRVNGSELVPAGEDRSVVVIVNGDLRVDGTVWDFVGVFDDGDLTVGELGLINTDVVLTDGELCVLEGGYVAGDVYLGENARVSSDSECSGQIVGTVEEDAFDFDLRGAAALWTSGVYISGWAAFAALLLIGALLFAGVGGRQLWSSAALLTGRPGQSLLVAAIFWIGLVFLAVLLAVTVIGIPLAALLVALSWLIWLLGVIVAGTRIGALITRRPMTDPGPQHPYAAALIGALLISLVALLAVGGTLVLALSAIFGDGAGVFGALLGIPAALLTLLIWVIGLLGAGGLLYRALLAWHSREPELT
jgi:hypothetical protein